MVYSAELYSCEFSICRLFNFPVRGFKILSSSHTCQHARLFWLNFNLNCICFTCIILCVTGMSSIGTGYDLAASTFSPDGRIFQSTFSDLARYFLFFSNPFYLSWFQSSMPRKQLTMATRWWPCAESTEL